MSDSTNSTGSTSLTPEEAGLFPDPQNISVPTKTADFKYNKRITFGESGEAEFVNGLADPDDAGEKGDKNTAWMIGNNILSLRTTKRS